PRPTRWSWRRAWFACSPSSATRCSTPSWAPVRPRWRPRNAAATAWVSRWTPPTSRSRATCSPRKPRGYFPPPPSTFTRETGATMTDLLADLDKRLRKAIAYFWKQRGTQSQKQGGDEGDKDRGDRGAVTGGKHLDGFRELVAALLEAAGLQRATIYWRKKTELPGWFRAEKSWDLLVVADGKLVAIVEFKSQVGSFGNNFNNRTEESLGNATDLWAAYEEGAFRPSDRPWLGYLMLLEDAPGSNSPVRVKEPHFQVFPEFRDASY